MFKDKVRAKFKAGKGGNGKVSFYAGMKPSGGIGGDGGDVLVQATINLYDLGFINMDFSFVAENGVFGGKNNLKGAKGKDLLFKVPFGTSFYDMQGNLVLKATKDPQILLRGGRGGLGNYHYRTTGLDNLSKADPGIIGEEINLQLQLELYSDIIFVGFPNAGKSSILNAITNSNSKVASYAFTTIDPQLGRLNGLTLMDLPGLIEGTYEGKGLGTFFVKHTKSSRIVAHLITLESEDILKSYISMREEIKRIDESLYNKPELIILTKSDLISKDELDKKINIFKSLNKKVLVCSIYDYDSLETLKLEFTKEVKAL